MWKLSLHNSSSGFTIAELLVASFVSLLMLGMVMTTFLTNRRLVRYDIDRTIVQQNLRGAMDIIGMNIRLAGENLPSTFPAIEVIDGGAGPDELILRRNVRDEVVKLCSPVTSGSNDELYFAVPGLVPGCIYSDQMQNYDTWNSYLTDEGGLTKAYIYDPATQTGEFFQFDAVTLGATDMYLTLAGGETWSRDYAVGQTAAYLVEEYHFYLEGGILKMIEDGETDSPRRVTFGLSNFQLTVELQDATVLTEFTSTDDWSEIAAVNVSLAGMGDSAVREGQRSLSASFFPRNVLSN